MGFVQSASNTASAGTSLTVTLSGATTAGNCLVVCVGSVQGTTNPTVSGITLGGSAGNFAAAKSQNTNADTNCEIWTDQNCAGGQTSVVISFNAGSGTNEALAAWVVEWSGLLTASAVDKTNGQNGTGTSFSSLATGTLTQAQEVIFGAVSMFASSSPTVTAPGAPWTELGTLNPTSTARFAAGYQQVAATTTQTYNGSLSGTSPLYGAVVVSLMINTGVSVPVGTAAVTVTANPVVPSYPGAPVNQWSSTFAQPSAFQTTPPALQSSVVALTPASSAGGGSGTPTAGNWLVCITGINETSAAAGVTVGVADDLHSFWRPAKVSTATALTRVSVWYTPNLAQAPGYVYVAPSGPCDAISVLVVEVTGVGPWDTSTGAASAYSAAATTLNLALSSPGATSFAIAAVCGDDSSHGQAFAPAGWVALQTVTSTNGTDHTCDAVLTSAILPTNSGSLSVNGTASSATDLSGVIVEFQVNAASPIPAGHNPSWPYLFFEAAFGGGFQTPQDQLTWTDLTSRLWSWNETTGIQYQLGSIQATNLILELDNNDNYLASDNPGSPYYSNALNANMSFQSGISPWTANNNATLSSSSAHVFASAPSAQASLSLEVTPDGVTANPGAQSERVAVTAGGTYSGSAWFYSAAGWGGGNGAQVDINWFTSGGTYISTSSTVQTPLPAATWTQVTLPGQTAPGGAAFATAVAQLLGTPSASAPFWVAEAALTAGSSAVATGLVAAGTPLRIRAALGTIGGVTVNRWYCISRNAEEWPQQVDPRYRRRAGATGTDIWSVLSSSGPSPYRGEVTQDAPYAWWPMDDQPLTGGVLPVSLRNAAQGNTNVLNITISPSGASALFARTEDGHDTQSGIPPSTPSGAIYAVGTNAGWMPGDPQSSPASYQTSNPVTANPGSAAWQVSGQLGNTGSNGWFASCNDASFPALSSGVTVEGWFNYAFYGSSAGFNPGGVGAVYSPVCQQPETTLTLFELATGSNPVIKLQLDTSGHLILVTYNGATGTNHTIYSSSDLRSQAWFHVAVELTASTWRVLVNGGATADASGSGLSLTSAWTWLIVNGDLGSNGGSSAGTGLVHGGNVSVSHFAVYPSQLPAWRILAHYMAACTGFGLLPAPAAVAPQWIATGLAAKPGTTQQVVADIYSIDGTGSGTYAGNGGLLASAKVVATMPNSIHSGPSAWATQSAVSSETTNPYYDMNLWVQWAGVAPSFSVYTASSIGVETNASTVCGSGETYDSGYGAAANGVGVGHTAGGTGSSPPSSASALGDTVQQRLERILGYGNAAVARCIDSASLPVQAAADIGGQQAAANLTNIVQSDGGLMAIDNMGHLTYWMKSHLAAQYSSPEWTLTPAAPPTPGAPLTAIPYYREDFSWLSDPQRVWNAILITPYSPDGSSLADITPSQASQVNASQQQYGAQPRQITSYLQSQTEMQSQADFLFANYGQARIRVEGVKVDAAPYPAAFPLILGVNCGDVVSITNWQIGGGGNTGTFRVSQIRRVISFGGDDEEDMPRAEVTLTCDYEPPSYWS